MTPRFPERQQSVAASRQIASTTGRRAPPSLVHKMLDAQKRERDAVLAEFVKVRGLMPLLMRRRNGGAWTRAERLELQDQLRALAHISPYLVVIMLPGSFAFLPVLAWWLDRRRHRRGEQVPNIPA